MEVLSIKDREDGGCDVELTMTDEEQQMLLEYAVVNLLKEHIEREEAKRNE